MEETEYRYDTQLLDDENAKIAGADDGQGLHQKIHMHSVNLQLQP